LAHVRATWKQYCEEYAVHWKTRNDLFAEAVATVRAEFTPAPRTAALPFDFDTARADPECLDSFLESDGTAVLVFEHGIQEFHPGEPEPFWFPFQTFLVEGHKVL